MRSSSTHSGFVALANGVPSLLGAITVQVLVLTVLVVPVAYWLALPHLDVVLEDVLTAWIPALALGVGTVFRLGPKQGTALGLLLGGVVGLALAGVLGATPMRGFGLLLPPTIGLALGLLDGIGHQLFSGFKQGVLVAMSIGFAVGLGLIARQGWTVLIPALLIGLVIGTLIGMRKDPSVGWRGGVRRPPWPLLGAVLFLVYGMTMLLRSEFIRGQSRALTDWSPLTQAIGFTVVFALLAPVLCFSAGSVLGSWLRPRFQVFAELMQYLRAMYVPIGAFALGYSLILVVFSGFYGSLYRLDPSHFIGPETGTVDRSQWLFFALYSAVGTAYSSLKPASGLANGAVAAQSLLGVGWAVVVFAAVMSHLQPRLAAISERVHRKMDSEPERQNSDDLSETPAEIDPR